MSNALHILRTELVHAMQLAGCCDVANIDQAILTVLPLWLLLAGLRENAQRSMNLG